jgi:hypothetical protein
LISIPMSDATLRKPVIQAIGRLLNCVNKIDASK